jgi:cytochrome c-type biogenesis protein CcmH/NrfG
VTPRRWAWLLAAAVAAYLVLAGVRGWALVTSGDATGVFLGVAVLALPIVGAWVVWREIAFGYAMQEMGRRLEAEGDLPIDDFARMPSGRIAPDDAKRFLADERARVEERPDDWKSWYRFGLALDASRDRRRARAAMREARRLFDAA